VNPEGVEPAFLNWRGDQPFAPRYDDIYYSDDGLEEFQRVFLQPSALLERDDLGECLQVAELGFGTGLNFVLCAQALLAQPHKRLHYIAFEAHPLTEADWLRLSAQRPQPLFKELAMAPPPLLTGWHRRSFANGRVHLSVYHGDVLAGLQDLNERQQQPIDAWFLDGFDPRKNPAMWQPEVLAAIGASSIRGTRVCTFTASGQVRRGLNEVGFTMRRVDQRPRKRESLAGVFNVTSQRQRSIPPQQIRIFGAGIAGCSVARALADQDIDVQLFDPGGVAGGGSRMQASALHCRLLGDLSATAEFRARAYHHARPLLTAHAASQPIGAVQLAITAKEVDKQRRIAAVYATAQNAWLRFLDAQSVLDELGLEARSALLFNDSAIINLPRLCTALVDHPRIQLVQSTGQGQPDVIACASDSRHMTPHLPLEIGDVFGQLDWITPPAAATSGPLNVAIVGNGYVLPNTDHWAIGSTYEQSPWEPETASAHNIDSNRAFLGAGPIKPIRHQRAARCVSSDRDPVIGKVDEHVWITTAHGSMGSSSAPFAASIIASDILGWIAPASPQALKSVAPDRFIARQARRGVKKVGA
jgi:tRNA 5-methylaminomethyl-2-thiouridine biosynthesis bifunctional protein